MKTHHSISTDGTENPAKPRHHLRNALAVLALALSTAGAAHAQAYVNVTVGGAFAPGVYGQVSIGNNPPPPVLNVQPVVVGTPVYGAPVMYLHVAPEEYRDWGHYCGRYYACGRPVHFLRVEESNRWWEHHNEHLRGEGYYRKLEERREDYRYDRRERNEWHERREERRDERRHEH